MPFGRAAAPSLASQLFGRQPAASLALLRAAWPHAVGKEIARRTEVLAIRGRTLLVRVPDAGWQKVLHRMERDILARMKQLAGDLGPMGLGFSLGPVADAAGAPPPARRSDPPPAPAEVEAAAAAIDDPELRASFLRAAALYLEAKSHHA
jgi:Dna[CI] antecedent, DciA